MRFYHLIGLLSSSKAEILSPDTTDILGWVPLYGGTVLHTVGCLAPSLASPTSAVPPSSDDQKYFQTLSDKIQDIWLICTICGIFYFKNYLLFI